MESIITTKEDLRRHVLEDYNQYATELNGLFFDFMVEMPKREILEACAELQFRLNGDDVEYPDQKGLDEVYKGNCKDYLESLNSADGYHRYCYGDRDYEVDFVF